MLDVLLEAGADINARSTWWAGGFGLLDGVGPALASYAISRGAIVDVHAAARLGMLDTLRNLISNNPALVHARGGDGQTPLHFASNIPVAEYLLQQGADINAIDVDHESTPAQYMVQDRQEILRYLIHRGCKSDLLMAAALGDLHLASRLIDADPNCVRIRVTEQYFPMKNKRAGGTIYQWTLGSHVSPHEVAKEFGHAEVFELLMQRSPPDVQFLASCWLGDEAKTKALLTQHPNLTTSVIRSSARELADAARNNNLKAVRLLLEAGFPPDTPGQHGATSLHWACFHGNTDMAKLILKNHPPLEKLDAEFKGTPVGWAIYGSEHGWYCRSGDYAGTVRALLEAGAKAPERLGGSDSVRTVLHSYGVLK